jgi:hypothetical protein
VAIFNRSDSPPRWRILAQWIKTIRKTLDTLCVILGKNKNIKELITVKLNILGKWHNSVGRKPSHCPQRFNFTSSEYCTLEQWSHAYCVLGQANRCSKIYGNDKNWDKSPET